MEKIEKKIENHPGPCLEKNCSYCCDPVKVDRFFPEEKIPTNEKGEKIWKERTELLTPESQIDRVRLKSYDCTNFDHSTGKCTNYENRPNICKHTSCIDKNSKESPEEQHEKLINDKLISIK